MRDGVFGVQYSYCSACCAIYYLLLAKRTGTYNEHLKCCLENYTELEWKSVQTSLVGFCHHLNGEATSVFV